MLTDFLVVAILLLVNGFLSMSELAVVSSRRSRLQAMANRGNKGARKALALAEHPGRFLSAVQLGMTLIGLAAGAFSGASIAEPLGQRLEAQGIDSRLASFVAFGGVVGIVTYLSLVVGELVPKQLALRSPEAMASRVAPAMAFLTRLCWPVVVLLEVSSRTVLRWIGTKPEPRATLSREEIKLLTAEAERAGVMAPQARTMVIAALRLADRKAGTIMTPSEDVDWVDLSAPEAELFARIQASPHSRLPASTHGGAPGVRAVIRSKDLLDRYLAGEKPDPSAFAETAPTVPETASVLQAMEVLRATGVRMVLVVDRHGVFKGLITTTNILEAVAGAFPVAGEARGPSWTRRADGSWLFDADLPVDEMVEHLGIALADASAHPTVADFVLAHLSRAPAPGDLFTLHGWRFEIVDLDGTRIDKVLASRERERRRRPRPTSG